METNALLFAVLKRHEIRDTIDGLVLQPNARDTSVTDKQRRDYVALINRPTFWSDFDTNYAERLLGEDGA